MNPAYILPRLVRHFLPERIVRFLLLRSLVIKPGLETRDPQAAVQRYVDYVRARGLSLDGSRVMVFGYGGRFDIGVGLLEAGAGSVILCDKYAAPDDRHNRGLLPAWQDYLMHAGGVVRPRNDRIRLLEADIREIKPGELPLLDLVISNSVYEHLEDVPGITRALVALTRPGGLHIHFVDLRDHFFKYPFEMLCYSENAWRNWLNPSSNHNRYRVRDYRSVFEQYFGRVELTVLERDEAEFNKIRDRIRPVFISGDIAEDSVTLIRVAAFGPSRRVHA